MDYSYKHNGSFLDALPFRHLLSQDEMRSLEEQSNIIKYKKKDIIFRQNTRTSHIMLILNGMVKIFKEGRNERAIILKISTAGQFVGLLSVLGDQIYQYSTSAVEDTEICMTDFNTFRNIIMENGRFALQVMNIISQEGLFIFDRLLSQSHKQLPGRIADVLLYFANDIFKSQSFTFPLTRRELAELAGTTKESFIRTLSEFKNDKIIILNGADVEIVSMNIVKTLSQLG